MSTARLHAAVSIALATVVGVELALAYAPVPAGLARTLLLLFAAAGFCVVVAFHMHLRTEPRGLKLLFALPFVFPVGFAIALVLEAWLARGVTP